MAIKFLNTVQALTDVLYVDASTNRVGIGTTTPDAGLEVVGSTGVIIDSGTTASAKLTLIGTSGGYGGGGIVDVIGGALDYTGYSLNLKNGPSTLEAVNSYLQYNGQWSWDGNKTGNRTQPYTSYNFQSQGSSQMVIYNNNVGIGTSVPSKRLVVRNGTSNTDIKILAYNSTAGTEATLRFSTIASDANYEKAAIIARNAASSFGRSDMHFALDSTADSGNVQFSDTKMTILNGGNVGIGITDPSHTLEVKGTVQIKDGTTSYLYLQNVNNFLYGDTYGNTIIRSADNFRIQTKTGGGESVRVNSAGNVGIGATNPITSLTLGTGSSGISFQSSSTTINSGKIAVIKQVEVGNGNGHLAFETYQGGGGGSERMRILNDGNVGIGMTSPPSKLSVSGGTLSVSGSGAGFGVVKLGDPTDSNPYVGIYRSAAVAIATSGNFLNLGGYDGIAFTTGAAQLSGQSERMRILSNGNVGIGTDNPSEKLEVGGKVYIESQGVAWDITTPGTSRGALHLDPVGNGDADTGNAITFGASDVSSGSTAQAGIYTRTDGNYGTRMYLATTDSYASGSKTRMTIFQNGNVGINDAAPSYKLDVAGTGRFTDILRSDKFLQIPVAGTTVNEGKGVGLSLTDDFPYVGNDSTTRYLNHYGMGIHKPLRASIAGGNGAYLSGYFGVDIFTAGISRVHVNQNGYVGVNQTNPQYTLDANGEIHSSTYVSATAGLGVDNTNGQLGRGISLYGGPTLYPQYGLLFAQTVDLGTYGGVTGDWATYMTMNASTTRGWIWKAGTINSTSNNVASISGAGQLTLASTATATNFILSSDETLKDNIKEIDTKHVDVDWKNFELKSEPGIKRAGVIAQELEIKHPEFVRTADDGLKSVAYIDLLITKIAELEARLEKAGL